MILGQRNSGFLDCGVGAILGNTRLILPSVIFDDISCESVSFQKLSHNKWFNSLSTGSLPLDGSSIRIPKRVRPGSCPLPKYILNNSGYQGDLGETNEEITHQPLFPLESPPPEIYKNVTCLSEKRPVNRSTGKSPPGLLRQRTTCSDNKLLSLRGNGVLKETKNIQILTSSESPWISHKKSRKYRKTRSSRRRGADQFSLVGQRIDPGGKVVGRHNEMSFGTMKSFNWKINKPHRAGVIVYTVFEGTLLFGLGIDLIYGNITDFGGQVSYTEDRNAVVGGLREYDEETHGIFGKFDPEQVKDCKVALRNDMMIMFIPLDIYPERASNQFLKVAELSADREIKELIWLNKKDLFKLISQGHIERIVGRKTEVTIIYKLLGNFMKQLRSTFHDFTKEL
uniref:NUDIX hydrolase n=1 Tax=Pithovirus LCPAC202 TaxID=2506592 RepID=A0A481Z633_9VIRU|nr:MAG: NUDIX hydrolase [Pithovirus LCPAC202]